MSVLVTAIKPQQAKAIAVVDDALIVSTLVTVAAAAGVAVVAGNAYRYWQDQYEGYKAHNPDAATGLKGALELVKWKIENKSLKSKIAVTLGETAYTAAQKFFGWWQTEQGEVKPGTQIVPEANVQFFGVEGLSSYSYSYTEGTLTWSYEFPEVQGMKWWVVDDDGYRYGIGIPVDGQDHEFTIKYDGRSYSFNTAEKKSNNAGYINVYENKNGINYFVAMMMKHVPSQDIMLDLDTLEYPYSGISGFLQNMSLEGMTASEEIVEISPTYNPTADETEEGVATPLHPLPATNEVEISLPVTTIPQTVVDSVDDSLVVPQEAYEELSLAIQDTVAKAVADAVPLAVEQSLAIAVTPPVAGEIEMQGDYTVGGLASVFPFCIPFDLVNMMRSLVAGRRAPRIELPFVIPNLVNYTMVIDLSSFDSVASILRGMEFLAFAVGLAMVTRYLIKG